MEIIFYISAILSTVYLLQEIVKIVKKVINFLRKK